MLRVLFVFMQFVAAARTTAATRHMYHTHTISHSRATTQTTTNRTGMEFSIKLQNQFSAN